MSLDTKDYMKEGVSLGSKLLATSYLTCMAASDKFSDPVKEGVYDFFEFINNTITYLLI